MLINFYQLEIFSISWLRVVTNLSNLECEATIIRKYTKLK